MDNMMLLGAGSRDSFYFMLEFPDCRIQSMSGPTGNAEIDGVFTEEILLSSLKSIVPESSSISARQAAEIVHLIKTAGLRSNEGRLLALFPKAQIDTGPNRIIVPSRWITIAEAVWFIVWIIGIWLLWRLSRRPRPSVEGGE
jgi:hypothetical protein